MKNKEIEKTGNAPWPFFLLLACLVLVAWDTSLRFKVGTSMDHFLPSAGEKALYRVSRSVLESTLTKRMLVTISWPKDKIDSKDRRDLPVFDTSLSNKLAICDELKSSFGKISGIKRIVSGPPAGLEPAFFDIYFPRRFSYYSLSPEEDFERYFSDEALSKSAHSLKEQLLGPAGIYLKKLAPQDPWLLFPKFLEELKEKNTSLDVVNGQFFSRPRATSTESPSAVFFIELADSALNSAAQGPLLQRFDEETAKLHSKFVGGWTLESTGANRFALKTEQDMKADIERIALLSTLGLLTLFILFFRSWRRILFILLPLVSGLLLATWLSLIVYGQIHALTLAFGGSLIGVAIDYPVHVLCYYDLDRDKGDGPTAVRSLSNTLCLAAGTTLLGLIGLAWTAFPGLREIALFTCSGVATALVLTFLSSFLLKKNLPSSRTSQVAADHLTSALTYLGKNRRLLQVLVAGAVVLTLWGGANTHFAPGLESLAPLDRVLMNEDARVRKRVDAQESGQLIVHIAPSLEQALVASETSSRILRKAMQAGEIHGFTSPSSLLRSHSLQERALALVQKEKSLPSRTRSFLKREGFVTDAFENLEEDIQKENPSIDWNMLKKTALRPLLESLVIKSGDEYAILNPLREVSKPTALKNRLRNIPFTHYFSRKEVLNGAYDELRQRTTALLLVGLLLVTLVAWLRYREPRRVLAAIAPALLASGATIGLLTLGGVEINLLHLLGLLLVCSMGVDYGIFLVDATSSHLAASLLSISIGCMSTVLSFGALALSTSPALHSLGLTIGLGVLLSLVLAPTAFLILGPQHVSPQSTT